MYAVENKLLVDIHMEKNNFDPYFIPYRNNNLTWILGPNVKTKIKDLKENEGECFRDFGVGNNFFF